jgi:hypothetical protein
MISLRRLQMAEPKGKGKYSTLWTVMILLGILLILAAIAIPDFLTFSSTCQKYEPKNPLGAIYTIQIAYTSEFGNYAGGDNCFEMLRWSPEGETEYSYYCGTDKIECTDCDGKCPDPVVPEYKDGAFTIFAVGNIDDDEACDVWTMDDAKNLSNIKSDLDD